MPLICYTPKAFAPETMETIELANEIIAEYADEGYDLTLRQLYYQFVARDLIPNSDREYNRLGRIVSDARLAGLIDWETIVDRTRNVRRAQQWETPEEIVQACARSYRIDRWKGQKCRPEVWIEKDALVGVFEDVCRELDVACFSCRGYTSQSEMWSAAQRLMECWEDGPDEETAQLPVILHFGDHDPSGIDMTRDIEARLQLFMDSEHGVLVKRLALNRSQIDRYKPPPNPAKVTDSRAAAYIREHGHQSWELDSLPPQVLVDLVRRAIGSLRDDERYQERLDEEAEDRAKLEDVADRWEELTG